MDGKSKSNGKKRRAPEGGTFPSCRRLQDWDQRLLAFLRERRAAGFAWGENDCCLFVCDALLAMTRVDPAAELRGYRTERQALRMLAQHGGLEALVAGMAERYGLTEVPPALAQRGDVALLELENGATLMLVDFNGHQVIGPTAAGFARRPLDQIRRAWRVH